MTPEQEQEMHRKRDAEWIAAVNEAEALPPAEWAKAFRLTQPLYDGTSFQKRHYPKHYEEFLKTQTQI